MLIWLFWEWSSGFPDINLPELEVDCGVLECLESLQLGPKLLTTSQATRLLWFGRKMGSFDSSIPSNGRTAYFPLTYFPFERQGNKPWISLPRGKGIRLTIAEERDKRLAAKQSSG